MCSYKNESHSTPYDWYKDALAESPSRFLSSSSLVSRGIQYLFRYKENIEAIFCQNSPKRYQMDTRSRYDLESRTPQELFYPI